MEISRRNVLVVDDDIDWLDLMERRLKRFGVHLVLARDGVEAVKLLDEQPFDLVITDTNMPYMDGISLLKFIRSCDQKLPVIVFFCSLWGSALRAEDLTKIGATAVLEKRDCHSPLDLLLSQFLSPGAQDLPRGPLRPIEGREGVR